MELEHLLSPYWINYLVEENTLVEEHIAGIPGCGVEDNNWKPLTPYDKSSVMHYFCGGAGSMTLALSPTDVAGHRGLYGAQ